MENHDHIAGTIHGLRFVKETLMDSQKIKKSQNRWDQFIQTLSDINANVLKGPILDFGCGIGYFLVEGLKRDYNVWGVDARESKIQRYRRLLRYLNTTDRWGDRGLVGDGFDLPFASERFSCVCSWYVLEHVENPGGVLREMARILRPGGVLAIKAQDARNGWEGHYKIPWIPFLSGSLMKAWLEAFDKTLDPDLNVVEITQPQVEAVLTSLNCSVVVKAPQPEILIENHWQLRTERQVRAAAARIKGMLNTGQWRPQPENLFVYAVKNK